MHSAKIRFHSRVTIAPQTIGAFPPFVGLAYGASSSLPRERSECGGGVAVAKQRSGGGAYSLEIFEISLPAKSPPPGPRLRLVLPSPPLRGGRDQPRSASLDHISREPDICDSPAPKGRESRARRAATFRIRQCVIPGWSQRADARPMTGSAKQSSQAVERLWIASSLRASQ